MGALTELSPELVVGWGLWVGGGLLLTLWFVRRSRSTRLRDVSPEAPHVAAARMSGTHAVAARPMSGTHAVAGRRVSGTHPAAARHQSGTRAAASQSQSSVNVPDAFAELRALLDQPEDPPKAN
jgi:hypothetical protein